MFSATTDPVPRAPRAGGSGLGTMFGLLAGVAAVPLLVYYAALLLAGALTTGAPDVSVRQVAAAVWTSPGNPAAALPPSATMVPGGCDMW